MQTFMLLSTSTSPAYPCLPQGSPWRNPADFLDGELGQQQHCLRTFRGEGEWGLLCRFLSCRMARHFLRS